MQKVTQQDIQAVRDDLKDTLQIQSIENHKILSVRIDETERFFRSSLEQLTQEVVKLSKDTFYEFDQIDRELQKLKLQQVSDMRGGAIYNSEQDSIRIELRDIKLRLEKLNDEVAIKSNIKDVCALVDLKANTEEVEKNFGQLFQEMQVNCATKSSLD